MNERRQARPALAVLPIFALAAAGASGATQAATLDEIKQRGYMVVAVETDSTPYAKVQEGKRSGFDAELLNRLRKTVKFEIREQPMPASALAGALKDGTVDAVAASLEITPDRQRAMDFAPPVAESTLYYLKRADDSSIKGLSDLGGKPLGMRTGSASFLALTEIEHGLAKAGNKPLGKPTQFGTESEALQALQASKVDYVLDNVAELAEAAHATPKRFAVGQPVAHQTFVGWAVAKGNADLLGLLQNFMLKQRDKNGLVALQQKYLGWKFDGLPESVTAKDWWTTRQDKPTMFTIPSMHVQD
jgi:polar amino acid transport system substrate-binding protein